MRSLSRAATAVLGVVCVALAATTTASADPKGNNRTQLPQQVPDTGVKTNGRDTAPGQLAKEAAAEARLREITRQDDTGLTPVKRADGVVMLDLEDRFQSVAVAVRQLDGRIGFACHSEHSGVEAARKAADGTAPAPVSRQPALEEK